MQPEDRSGSDYEAGMRLGERLGGESFSEVVERLRATDGEAADYLVRHAYGGVMSRPDLALEDRELAIISALAVQGYLPQLKWHMAAALRIGVAPEAIREVLVQGIPFAGWPSALNALNAMKETFAECQVALAELESVPAAPTAPDTLTEIGRQHGSAVYADFAAVERTLSEYDSELPGYLTRGPFALIYPRPGLDLRRRELIAVAMLTALQRLPQLAAHIRGAQRVGCTASETKEVIITMLLYVGWPATLNALDVWRRADDAPPADTRRSP